MAEMAERSVRLNGLTEEITIVHGDIKEASQIFGKTSFSVVTSNPPYMPGNHGLKNSDESKAISRHEVLWQPGGCGGTGGGSSPAGRAFLYGTPAVSSD